MIEVEHLRKQYGDFTAVHDVSFTAEAGKIYGLLGPNGAGKSTTIGCISGLLVPSGGNIRVMGHDVVQAGKAARASLGIVPQELALYEDLSARENLHYWGSTYKMKGSDLKQRVQEVLEQVGLADRAKEPCKNFSGGMKRRLNFACGIVHRPKVLLLDEPTVGVDPQSRVKLLELVRDQARENGMCVLYTTHYMEEAESLCDHLGIVDEGRMPASGTLDELRGILGERDLVRLTGAFDPEPVRDALTKHAGGGVLFEIVQVDNTKLTLASEKASERLGDIFIALNVAGAQVHETTVTRPNLETLFIKLTGKELRQ